MYLSNIKLWNFRKFSINSEVDLSKPHLDLNFTQGLNVIIGENDSGKSAIIDAIKLVLKTHSYEYIRVDDDDFFEGASRFRIELTFDGLTANEAKNFIEWLGWEGEKGKERPILKVNYDIQKKDNKIQPVDIKGGFDDEGYLLTAEAKEYLKVTYLKPLRDAENELTAKRNSRLSQILLGHETFKGKEEGNYLVKIFKDLKENLESYFESNNKESETDDTGGKQIKERIDAYIKAFYGNNYETEFTASDDNIKSILEKLTLSLKGVRNPGLGTLNRLFMAAELLHLTKSNWTGLRLGLVEELEAHLHPQAQMQIVEALQEQENIQLILTTHSPNLASKVKLENLIICNNSNAFPMGPSYTKLNPNNYKFLEKFLDVTKSNLFFAKGVILVEGWSEEILLPSIAKAIGIDLTEKGVSVVNIGNTGFDHYAKIFLRKVGPNMKVPVAVITDPDIREYEKQLKLDDNGKPLKNDSGKNVYDYIKKDVQQETQQEIAKITAKSENNVKYFPAPHWTLEYSLFKSISLSNVFKNTVKAIHKQTNWDTNFEKVLAKKLINKTLEKTDIAYSIAAEIDEDFKKGSPEIVISDNADDSINYLIKAIKYVSDN